MDHVARRRHAAVRVAAVVAVAVLVGCTSGPPGGSSTPPSASPATSAGPAPASATPSAGGSATAGSVAGTPGTAMPTPAPTSADAPSTAPTAAPVGTGTLTVAGDRVDVAGDCVLAARRRRGGPLRAGDQLTVAVTGRRGAPDPLSLTLTVADRDDRTLRVDADDGATPRAWTGAIDQVRVVQPRGATTARLAFNATVDPVPGRGSLPAGTAGSSRRSRGGTPSAPAGPSRVDPRPSVAPAAVPDDAGPVRVAASLTCRATTNDTQ